jgi:SagB-type dehydrogenase family enzyme
VTQTLAIPAQAPPTVRLSQLIGIDDLTTPDPTEDYHEASRLYPGVIDPLVRGTAQLERSAEMRASVVRAVKRHAQLPFEPLPPPFLAGATLADTLRTRRSRRQFGDAPILLASLGTVLHAGYGVSGTVAGTEQSLRAAPSGGALFPLELYVVCQRVDELEPALYHYDPLRHGLERLRPLRRIDETEDLTPYPEVVTPCAAVVVISAMFWRSRFKYGDRAYRFTLLEAGHVGQNMLLAAEALGLAAVPLGGFFDRRADALLGVDGLDEAAIYLFAIGAPG